MLPSAYFAYLEKIKKIVPYRLMGQMLHVVQNTYYKESSEEDTIGSWNFVCQL